MNNNIFDSWMDSYIIKDYITNKNIEVGDFTYYSGYYHGKHFEDYCVRYLSPDRDDVDKLKIGKFCSIGSGAIFIMAGNQGHRYDWITSYPFYYSTINENAKDGYIQSGDTVVGNDVWIGTEAVIMPGVKIGDGAVIGTRALVTKDVEPYTIIGGNPAKPIKKRFTQDEIKMLLEMKWWNWPIEKIKNNMLLLCSNNIKLLFEEFLNE
ncbi:CatB-related O-acetyltransferase [Tepidibacter hydrothermalis]